MTDESRRWKMYAGHQDGDYSHFYPHPTIVAMCGYKLSEIAEVELVEYPDGPLKGWIDPDGTLSMIVHHAIFEVQFPYGSKVEEEQGEGVGVRVRVEPLPVEDETDLEGSR